MSRSASSPLLDAISGLIARLLGRPVRPAPVYVPVLVRRPAPVRIPVGRR